MTAPQLEKAAVRRARAHAARRDGAAPVLFAEIARRMDERLALMKIAPHVALDAGCGTGAPAAALRKRYPRCTTISADDVMAVVAGVQGRRSAFARALAVLGITLGNSALPLAAELDALPVADASVGLVWSNLALHRHADPLPVLREVQRVLSPEGLFMFSTLGPDTLRELRQAFARADAGAPHVHGFVDMHDLGDMLVASGFSAPVMDMEVITLTYKDVTALAKDLKAMGSANALDARRRTLSGRALWDRVSAAYEPYRKDGRLPASFEIVYGHAWKAMPRKDRDATGAVQVVQFRPQHRP